MARSHRRRGNRSVCHQGRTRDLSAKPEKRAKRRGDHNGIGSCYFTVKATAYFSTSLLSLPRTVQKRSSYTANPSL
jgi:hypothetical protein